MEVIQLLEMCQKQHITVKKAFSRLGLTCLQDGNRPFTKLTEDEVFAYLMNWIMNELKYEESVIIRYKADKGTYQMKFHYNRRHFRVTKPSLISTDVKFTHYEWTESDTFNEMTCEKINASIRRAEERNNCRNTELTEDYEAMAWVLNEPGPELSKEDYEILEGILDV